MLPLVEFGIEQWPWCRRLRPQTSRRSPPLASPTRGAEGSIGCHREREGRSNRCGPPVVYRLLGWWPADGADTLSSRPAAPEMYISIGTLALQYIVERMQNVQLKSPVTHIVFSLVKQTCTLKPDLKVEWPQVYKS